MKKMCQCCILWESRCGEEKINTMICRFVSNSTSVRVPPGQRKRSEPKEVAIESKESHTMSSGGQYNEIYVK